MSSPMSWEDRRSGLHDDGMHIQTVGPFNAGMRLGYLDIFLDTPPNCRECIFVGTLGHRHSTPHRIPCHPCMLSQKDTHMTLSLICCTLLNGRSPVVCKG